MSARIYQPARNAMQSGQAKTRQWVLEFLPETARKIDPLMGWTSSSDMNSQVRMSFDSKDSAVEFAKSNGMAYRVIDSHKRDAKVRQAGYAENFASDRRMVWTH